MKNKLRFLSLFGAFIILGFSGISQSESKTENKTPAESNQKTTTKFAASGWAVSCKAVDTKSPLLCDISQKITGSQGQILLAVALKAADKKSYIMDMQLPHGLDLPAGLQLQIDDGEVTQLGFSTSLASGTYATTKLEGAFIDKLRKGSILQISFDGTNKSKINVPVGLSGFARALAKLK